jgi:hypothetical protein
LGNFGQLALFSGKKRRKCSFFTFFLEKLNVFVINLLRLWRKVKLAFPYGIVQVLSHPSLAIDYNGFVCLSATSQSATANRSIGATTLRIATAPTAAARRAAVVPVIV